MRVLDEVATAIRLARGSGRLPILTPFGLEWQADQPLTPREWSVIQKHLGCDLPPLEFVQGHWFLPDGFATIWDLADCVACAHPEWESPAERTEGAWREAQIFAGVRIVLVEALNVDFHQVTRGARLKRDLGAE